MYRTASLVCLLLGIACLCLGLPRKAKSDAGKELCTPIPCNPIDPAYCCKVGIKQEHGICMQGGFTCYPRDPITCTSQKYGTKVAYCDTLVGTCNEVVSHCSSGP